MSQQRSSTQLSGIVDVIANRDEQLRFHAAVGVLIMSHTSCCAECRQGALDILKAKELVVAARR